MSESPFQDVLVLAPLTVGGNLPFRRLCTEFGAEVTVGEMAVARRASSPAAQRVALLRSHPDERFFGVQLADRNPETLAEATRLAADRGARRPQLRLSHPRDHPAGPGVQPPAQAREAGSPGGGDEEGGVPCPVTVKLRSGWKEGRENVSEVARVCEESGADAITLHGRTREQRYNRAADWDMIGRVTAERAIPVVGNGDILTWYEARERGARRGCARSCSAAARSSSRGSFAS